MPKTNEKTSPCSECKKISSSLYSRLRKVIKHRRASKVKHLLECNGTLALIKQDESAILVDCLFKNTVGIIESQNSIIKVLKVLSNNGVNLKVIDSAGQIIVLHLAVQHRLTQLIDFLIGHNVNLHHRDIHGNTILHFLIENESNILRANCDPLHTPKNLMLERASADFIRWMMSKSLDIDCKNSMGDTALHIATKFKLLHALPILLEHTKDVTIVNIFNMTALQTFAKSIRRFLTDNNYLRIYNNPTTHISNIYKKFVEKGFSVDVVDESECTPVHYAIKQVQRAHYLTMVDALKSMVQHLKNFSTFDPRNSILDTIMNIHENMYRMDFGPYTEILPKFAEKYYEITRILLKNGVDFQKVDDEDDSPLISAVTKLNFPFLKLFIEYEADLQRQYKFGNLIHLLINTDTEGRHNAFREVLKLLVNSGCDVNGKNHKSKTPLHLAVRCASTQKIETLIEFGANVNSKDIVGYTPLHEAIIVGRDDLLEFLVENGADFNARTNIGQNVLHLIYPPNLTVMEKLIYMGARDFINDRDADGNTVLRITMDYFKSKSYSEPSIEYYSIVKLLLSNRADVSEPSKDDISPLSLSVTDLNQYLLKLFISYGADLQRRYHDGNLLHCLIKSQIISHFSFDPDIWYLLVNGGCDVNGQDNDGKTPLHYVIRFFEPKTVEIVIKSGANVNIRDIVDGYTPVHEAVKRGNDDIINLLIENGADFNVITNNDETVLHLIKFPTNILIKRLMKVGDRIDINARDKKGNTVFHTVMNYYRGKSSHILSEEYHNIACMLVSKGAHVHLTNNEGISPLIATVIDLNIHLLKVFIDHRPFDLRYRYPNENLLHPLLKSRDTVSSNVMDLDDKICSIFDLLIDKDCDVNIVDSQGKTPLHLAVQHSFFELVKRLLKFGANVNSQDIDDGYTPLHVAMKCTPASVRTNIVEVLLNSGADVGIRTKTGKTVTHIVEDETLVGWLVQCGASINVTDDDGFLPLHIALLHNNNAMFRTLLILGADINDICDGRPFISPNWFSNSTLTINSVSQHLIQLRVANMPIDEQLNDLLVVDRNSEDIHAKCLVEIEQLKKQKINNSTTLYDFLHLNRNSTYKTLLENGKVKKIIDLFNVKEKFPMYYVIISSIYNMAIERRKILEPAKQAWYEITSGSLPDLCVHEIFSYLSNVSLRVIIDAAERCK